MTTASRQPFGTTHHGQPVELLTLDNGTLSCQIITFGAALRALWVPDRTGRPVDVVLGYETLKEYQDQDGYLGAVVGRFANRIAGGRFSLNGREYTLAVNNGPNHLHGGIRGFSYKVWTVEELTGSRAVLSLSSPDGEEGYPGSLEVRVTYQLDRSTLSIHYQACSDQDTPCNLTNHSYFNLDGQGSGPVLNQEISGYDHNYVVDGPFGLLRPAAWARSAASGIALQVDTTLPGLQFYTANFLEAGRRGKEGAVYAPRHAFCLETQFFPDSPNQPAFPSAILRAGEHYDHITRFCFSTED